MASTNDSSFLSVWHFFFVTIACNRNQGLGGGSELNVDSHKRLNSVRGSKVDIGVGVSDQSLAPCFCNSAPPWAWDEVEADRGASYRVGIHEKGECIRVPPVAGGPLTCMRTLKVRRVSDGAGLILHIQDFRIQDWRFLSSLRF